MRRPSRRLSLLKGQLRVVSAEAGESLAHAVWYVPSATFCTLGGRAGLELAEHCSGA